MDPESSVERCIRERGEELVRAVAVVTGSVPVAEDAVAEAFARAWEREQRGKTFDHTAGWVVTTALNVARNRWRRVKRERTFDIDRTAPAIDTDTNMDIDAAVAKLPRRQREAVTLYYLLDLDVPTTASVLGVSEGTIKTALSRARDALAVTLDPEEIER